MSQLLIISSKVKDGSMFDRQDFKNPEVIKNRERFLAKHDIAMEQTTHLLVDAYTRDKVSHETDWCRYLEVGKENLGRGMSDGRGYPLDALITRDTNHALMLAVADCIATVIYDPAHHVLMMSHLGRQSLEQDGGKKCIEYLTEKYQSKPSNLKLWMGPSAGKDVYPIWALDNRGMKEVSLEQLLAAGINPDNIVDNPAETDKDLNYFSFTNFFNGRADVDGDHMTVAMMR